MGSELFRLLAISGGRAVRHVERALKRRSISSATQFLYLQALVDAFPGFLFVGDLSNHGLFDVTDDARMIDSLVRKGWAERLHDDYDRRRVKVWATEAGSAAYAEAVSDYTEAVNEAFRCLDATDKTNAKFILEAISESMEELSV